MRHSLRMLLALPLLLLASCQSPEIAPRKPVSFTQYQPIGLAVGAIEIKEEYRSPLHAPNVEHLFPTSPAEAMRIWVKDRLRTQGGAKTLQVIVKDASVVQEPLPRTQGFKGVYTLDQSEKYNARLEVEMRIYGDGPLSEASISVVGTRSDTASENFSVAARDALADRMIRDLMALMNAELEKNFHQYFSAYVNYTPEM